ncbi:hypothetical protein [Anaerophaga thermohalophila]|jgi:hypothetical protein|uniref:hypothetical protein n=1 Tax=Anaerophaga thermohalophila TaxID=177400 RepID=UPI000237C819|nr:hypothetical protein [Anaerophaga thermohalophila]
MEDVLLQFIKAKIEERKKAKKHPTFCTLEDVRAEYTRALNQLWKDGKIEVGETINGKWIIPKNG